MTAGRQGRLAEGHHPDKDVRRRRAGSPPAASCVDAAAGILARPIARMPMVPTSRVIPSYEYRRTRWRNGGGWTREIHAEPADAGDWGWRLSIAEITADGPFSTFEGVDRELVLLAGEGLRLRFEDGGGGTRATPRPPPLRGRGAGGR